MSSLDHSQLAESEDSFSDMPGVAVASFPSTFLWTMISDTLERDQHFLTIQRNLTRQLRLWEEYWKGLDGHRSTQAEKIPSVTETLCFVLDVSLADANAELRSLQDNQKACKELQRRMEILIPPVSLLGSRAKGRFDNLMCIVNKPQNSPDRKLFVNDLRTFFLQEEDQASSMAASRRYAASRSDVSRLAGSPRRYSTSAPETDRPSPWATSTIGQDSPADSATQVPVGPSTHDNSTSGSYDDIISGTSWHRAGIMLPDSHPAARHRPHGVQAPYSFTQQHSKTL